MPLYHHTLRKLKEYIGRTFHDEELIGNGRKRVMAISEFEIIDVVLYSNDKNTYFFEYYNKDLHPNGPPEKIEDREYTPCYEFGMNGGMLFDGDVDT